jgi:hypothetical protein
VLQLKFRPSECWGGCWGCCRRYRRDLLDCFLRYLHAKKKVVSAAATGTSDSSLRLGVRKNYNISVQSDGTPHAGISWRIGATILSGVFLHSTCICAFVDSCYGCCYHPHDAIDQRETASSNTRQSVRRVSGTFLSDECITSYSAIARSFRIYTPGLMVASWLQCKPPNFDP